MPKYVSKFNILGETPIYVKDEEARQLLTVETENRETADRILQDAIEQEAAARASADTAERMARIDADNRLRALINESGGGTAGLLGTRGYIGMCHLNTPDLTALIYTEDFQAIHIVKTYPIISDAASLYHVGEWYYATYGRRYMKSKDLITWTAGANATPSPFGYSRMWGGHIQKMDDDRYIWLGTYQYRPDSDTFVNASGQTSFYFKTMYCYITFDGSGEIVFPGSMTEFPLAPSDSLIDPWLLYNPDDRLYYYAFKDEHTATISWYRGGTINNLSLHYTNQAYGVETVCMVKANNGDIITTGDFYLTKLIANLGIYFDDDQIPLFSWLKRDGNMRNPIWNSSATSGNLRHCTWIPCDDETYSRIFAMGMHFDAVNNGHKPFTSRLVYLYNKSGNAPYVVQPVENLTYIEIYENIPALTLEIPGNRFVGGSDIVVWPNYDCAVTFRNQTFNLTRAKPLILKYTHNYYYPFMPDE